MSDGEYLLICSATANGGCLVTGTIKTAGTGEHLRLGNYLWRSALFPSRKSRIRIWVLDPNTNLLLIGLTTRPAIAVWFSGNGAGGVDSDGDGMVDAEDTDENNDCVVDADDQCPLESIRHINGLLRVDSLDGSVDWACRSAEVRAW